MKLNYYDLIMSDPITITGVGQVKCPSIKDISRITYSAYETYLLFLNCSPDKYCTELNPQYQEWYEGLSDNEITSLTMYDIATSSKDLSTFYASIFSFFFVENVIYDMTHDCFIVIPDTSDMVSQDQIGVITKDNFSDISNIILQMNYIKPNVSDLSKVKNKKGLERFKKIQQLKKKNNIEHTSDPNMELGNVISAICSRHNSINFINIRDLTVYQVWDTFNRMMANTVYDSAHTSISVWGNKENSFKFSNWFKKI